ncbi:MAG: CPBP family intramembrane glutamic endopeptidase [Candidatus Eremiobacteraeota bacterium]|nr:CPBP family intramembrane glutamic endopeptidase [Candidatus Eremiobacteraeota bacterium]
MFLLFAMQCAVLVIAVVWGLCRRVFWWNSLVPSLSLLWGVLLGFALALLNLLLYTGGRRVKSLHIEWIFENLYFPLFGSSGFAGILAIAALSGFCEEALFRGVLQQEWGIVAASACFGALHMGHRRLIFAGIWTALLGGLLGYSYSMTGNLLVPMAAHGISNLAGLLYVRYCYRPSSASSAEGD